MTPEQNSQPVYKQVGEEICHLRLGLGLTQTELGKKVGISQDRIRRYESGEGSLSIGRLAALSAVLGVEIGHFFPRKRRAFVDTTGGFGLRSPGEAQDLSLARKITRIRCDKERRDILLSIEETVTLILRNQKGDEFTA